MVVSDYWNKRQILPMKKNTDKSYFDRVGRRERRTSGEGTSSRIHRFIKRLVAMAMIVLSLCFFIYPAVTISYLLLDRSLKNEGQSRLVPHWFDGVSRQYNRWAGGYLASGYAAKQAHEDVAATEWPMFGSVFFLVTAQDLQARGLVDVDRGVVREAVEKAAAIVASPVTATWVTQKWGASYLERDNVFYRMLLILGLSSYEKITGNPAYHSLMSGQRIQLARELSEAKFHVKDDYPAECYPSDVLWAVAAIQRAARLDHSSHDELAAQLMAVLDGPLRAAEGLPAFQVDSVSGWLRQGARGCGNSGILLFAPELDRELASRWYTAYEDGFWQDGFWVAGFREMPSGNERDFMDVDSGPVLFGLGSVASAFGIGAAKGLGRLDHAVPLTLEAVACSWPTPFGFIVPGLLSYCAVQSWSLGEVALLFSMTRPMGSEAVVPYGGSVPGMVLVLLAGYYAVGILFIGLEWRHLAQEAKGKRVSPIY